MEQSQSYMVAGGNSQDGLGLCLLSLDGGGVRGLSSLRILKGLMTMLNEKRAASGLVAIKPCEVFDLIAGTSTGGLIAILLGRLEMHVDECIDVYTRILSTIFNKEKRGWPVDWRGNVKGRFDSRVLLEEFTNILETQGLSKDDLLNDPEIPEGQGCKVFVCTTAHETKEIVRLRNYKITGELDDLSPTILEAALATSAATSYFEPVIISGLKFVDGALGANNPVDEVWNEAQNIWCPDTGALEQLVKCFVSVGTGNPGVKPLNEGAWKLFSASMVEIAVETERTAALFLSRHRGLFERKQYFRFNVDQGLQNVGLDEATKEADIRAATDLYLRSQAQKFSIRDCAANLKTKQCGIDQELGLNCQIQPKELSVIELAKQFFSVARESLGGLPSKMESVDSLTKLPEYLLWSSSSSNQILWITGPPGTGKTTFARSAFLNLMENRHDSKKREAVCEMGSHSKPSMPRDILRSLIGQILHHDHDRIPLVQASLHGRKNTTSSTGPTLQKLLSQSNIQVEQLWPVFRTVLDVAPSHELVVVLDEVDTIPPEVRSDFLANIREIWEDPSSNHNRWKKLLIVSRPYADIRASLEGIPVIDEDTERKHCLSSLLFNNFHTRSDQIKPPQRDTIQWIWTHPAYNAWLDGKSSVLWIQGKPGSGKSTLAKEIRTKLSYKLARNTANELKTSQTQETIIADFFFNARGSSSESSHKMMLQSLLYQVLGHGQYFFPVFRSSFRRLRDCSKGRVEWPYEALKTVFLSLAFDQTPLAYENLHLKTFLLIDAMDESEDEDENGRRRKETLSLLSNLCSRNGRNIIKIIVLSRPANEIEKEFKDFYQIDMQKENLSDIEAIVDAGIYDILEAMNYGDEDSGTSPEERGPPKKVLKGIPFSSTQSHRSSSYKIRSRSQGKAHKDELKLVREYLVRNAAGVILWIVLIIKELTYQVAKGSYSVRELKTKLESLPTDLGKTYAEITDRLCKTHSDGDLAEARLMLTLAAFCQRPLTVAEFRDAIAVPLDPSHQLARGETFDEGRITVGSRNWAPVRRRMVELCGCLLEVATPSSGKEATVPSRIGVVRADHFVQLLHQTSREYLLRPGQAGPFGIDRYQANNLLAFVSLRYLMLSIPMEALQYRNFEDWTQRDYEAFVDYLVDRPLLGYVIEYLSYHMMEAATDETQSLFSSYMAKLLCQRNTHGWAFLSKLKHNSEQSMPNTAEEKARVQFQTKCLTLACKLGQAAVVRLMLQLKADPYLAVDGDRTPLQCAASTGSKTVVKMLLEGIDTDSSLGSSYASEGLYTAVENGYEDLVRLFLSEGCDGEVMGNKGSVVNVAVQNGDIRIAQLLLTQGANLENQNLDRRRPVHVAATKGDNALVKLLLKKGAYIDATAKEGETALHMAAKGGHDVVASTLLNHGAKIEQRTEYGETPLHRAAQYGRTAVAQVLLDREADIEVKANYGETPLFRAAESGHQEVMLLLLERGADIGATNRKGETCLYRAAANGHTGIVLRLLERGMSLESRTDYGRTILHEAVEWDHETLVRTLLEKGADTQAQDCYGRTALKLATEEGNEVLVQLLKAYTPGSFLIPLVIDD